MGRKRTGQIRPIGENKFALRIQTKKRLSNRGDFSDVFEGTREEAEEYLKACLEKLEDLEKNPEKTTTVSDLFRKFIDRKKKPEVTERTLVDYEKYLRLYISPVIGNILVVDFKPKDGRLFIEKLQHEKKLASPTIRKPFLQLKSAFDYAIEMEIIDKNPLAPVNTPKGGTVGEVVIPTLEETVLIFRHAPDLRKKALYMTAYYTGMRPEEYLALRWSEVDFQKKCFRLQRAAVQLPGKRPVFEKLKTVKSKRLQPMTGELETVLSEYRKFWLEMRMAQGPKWSNLDKEPDLVFPTLKGNVYLNSNLNRDLKNLLKTINGHDPMTILLEKRKAKKEGKEFIKPKSKNLINEEIVPYSFRHAFATHLLDAGATLKDVSDLLGHSSIRVTADTYLHISEERKSSQVDKLGEMIAVRMAG